MATAEPERQQNQSKEQERVFPEGNGNGKTATKTSSAATDPSSEGNGSRAPKCAPGPATQAQVRALYALTKRARYEQEDITSMLAPFDVSRFEDLPREAASKLIGYLQQEVAA